MSFISPSLLPSTDQAGSDTLNWERVECFYINLEKAGWRNQIAQDL